jgi:5-methylcytosine-specific restriction endonuclease McrA
MSYRIPESKRLEILYRERGRCWYCGIVLLVEKITMTYSASPSPQLFVPDHVTPISKGGTHEASNLVASCWTCNSSKKNQTLEEFRKSKVRHSGALFTDKQIDFWKRRGVKLPKLPESEIYSFYGEATF